MQKSTNTTVKETKVKDDLNLPSLRTSVKSFKSTKEQSFYIKTPRTPTHKSLQSKKWYKILMSDSELEELQ